MLFKFKNPDVERVAELEKENAELRRENDRQKRTADYYRRVCLLEDWIEQSGFTLPDGYLPIHRG